MAKVDTVNGCLLELLGLIFILTDVVAALLILSVGSGVVLFAGEAVVCTIGSRCFFGSLVFLVLLRLVLVMSEIPILLHRPLPTTDEDDGVDAIAVLTVIGPVDVNPPLRLV